jgi:hypothetical protein
MLLKCIGIWLLVSWHKENLWVLCNDDGPLRISLFTGNHRDPKPISTDVSADFSSENDTHDKLKESALRSYPIFNTTAVMEQSTSSELLDSREGNGSLSEHLLKLFLENVTDIEHGNRLSGINAQKGVVHEPEIVPQQDVYSNAEGHGSSVESTDESTEQNNNFPDKKCVWCLNNTSGIRNGSDDDCKKCCDAMQTGNNASDSVGNETYAAANQTDQDSSPENGSSSVKQDGHDCSSLDNISTQMTPLSRNRMQLDVTNGSNLLSLSPVLEKDLNATGPVIPVFITFTVLVVVAYAVCLYKRRSELWKWNYRYHEHTDNPLDDVHGI